MSGAGEHFSRFGGLWIDRRDAEAVAARKLSDRVVTEAEHAQVLSFIREGYLILERAVSDATIVAFDADLDRVFDGSMPRRMAFWGKDGHHVEPAERRYQQELECKLLDLHWTSVAAQELIFAPRLRRFLEVVFDDAPLAFQSLQFHRGSQQPIHQDTAFVPVAGAPLEFVASWIALEDVQPGAGELLYVPGSHRLPDLTFTAGAKTCPPGDPLLPTYSDLVRRHYEGAGLKPEPFLARKGDALLWAADLAHGGAPITRAESTRRSMVTHYCPLRRRPRYAERGGHEVRRTRSGGHVISHG